MFSRFKSFLFLLLLIVFPSNVHSQCAMCKAVIENGDETLAQGINNGITYLMIFPYLLVGVLLYFIYRYKKRVKN